MALGDAYATVQEYRDSKERTSVDDDTAIQRELKAVSRYLDNALGRPLGFNNDGTSPTDDVARVYDSPSRPSGVKFGWAEAENPWKGSGLSRYLDIDDHVSITTIDIDQSLDNSFSLALTASDYELLPRNAANMPEPEPYRTVAISDYGTQGAWLPGARIRVTGIGGWPSVPAAIVAATIELTAILRIESPRATNRVNEMNQVLSTSRAAQGIISDLTRTYLNPRAYV